jgi:hypothetical protein
MTQRLTDDEIRELRTQVLGFHSLRNVIRLLDEIEENRAAAIEARTRE